MKVSNVSVSGPKEVCEVLVFHLKKHLNCFSVIETACCSAMHVFFTHCVVRTRFDTIPRREATSRSVNLFRELFQVVNRIFIKSLRVVYGMIRVRSLVLMHAPS